MGLEYNEFILQCPEYLFSDIETRGRVKIVEFHAYINSNELNGHHIPHIHIILKNKNYVWSIDDKIHIIVPKKCPASISKPICSIIAKNLSICRKEWNRCRTLLKFSDEKINFKNINITRCEDYFLVTTTM